MKAILFDAAGTLFRVRGSVGEVYAMVAARHGVRMDAVAIEQRFRAAFRSMPPLAFPGVPPEQIPRRERGWWQTLVASVFEGARCDDFDELFSDLFAHFAQPESWEIFPDTHPTLMALRERGLRLGIVSNFDGRLIDICTGLGIAHAVDIIVMSSRAGFAKPDPRIFITALQQLGVTPTEALHVGDSERDDVAGAQAAGLHAVLIERGSHASGSPRRVRALAEIMGLL
jgi:putative hydrolase of the HAD superfamily